MPATSTTSSPPDRHPQKICTQIESLHRIRDAVDREDDSTVRTRSGPGVMAALRNLAVDALHLHGRTDIAEATHWATRNTTRPFTILGLTP
jgi:hypothetical protein